MYQPNNKSRLIEKFSQAQDMQPSASANTKGSWVNLMAGGSPAVPSATSFAYEAITIDFGQNSTASPYLFDLGIDDGAGNIFVIAENLKFSCDKVANEMGFSLHLPLHVPAGSVLYGRCQCQTASASFFEPDMWGHDTGLGGVPGFSRCVALFTPSGSRGVTIDPGTTANTKGAWIELISAAPNDIAAMFAMTGYGGDAGRTADATMLVDIGIGSAGNEYVVYPNMLICWGATRDGPANCPMVPPFAANIPAGTRVAARAQCSINTSGDRLIDLSVYGLVP